MPDIASLGIRVTTQGVADATRQLGQLEQQGERTERKASDLAKAWGVALGGAIVGGAALAAKGLQVYIRNTIEAEKVQAQLSARIKSTGAAAGLAIGDLNRMADSLQNVTTFDDEAIGEAQALLLTFTKIGKDVFPRATEAVLDMSTALGGDLKGAAMQVGKALNDPLQGVTALARAGVQFSEAQKEVIEQLVETGRQAEAQAIVLKELETQMGGSARAARDTLGGALTALGNSFDNLLEGDSGSDGIRGTRQAIEGLTRTLNDPEIKRGVDSTATGLVTIANAAVQVIAKLGEAGSALREYFAENRDKGDASLRNRRDELETQLFGIERSNRHSLPIFQRDTSQLKDEIKEIDRILSDRSRRSMFEGVTARVDSTFLDRANEKESKFGGATATRARTAAVRELSEAEKAYQDIRETNALIDEQAADAVRDLFFERQRALELAEDEAKRRFENNQDLIAGMQSELGLMRASIPEREKMVALRQLETGATEEQKRTVAGLADELVRTREQIGLMDQFRGSLSDTFADVFTGAKSAKDALKDLFDSLFEQAARALADRAVQQLFGSFGSAGGGATGNGWASFLGSLFSSSGGRAIGGPVSAGRAYAVSEKGEPELFVSGGRQYLIPPKGGQVVPMASGGAGGGSITVEQNIYTQGRIDPRTASQLQQEAARRQKIATVRGGR